MTAPDRDAAASSDESSGSVPATPHATSRSFRVQPPDLKLRKQIEEFRRDHRQEFIRGMIAVIALFLVVLTVVLGYVAAQNSNWDNAKDWLSAVLPAETGILGSALGFYFGANRREGS